MSQYKSDKYHKLSDHSLKSKPSSKTALLLTPCINPINLFDEVGNMSINKIK